AAGRGRARKRLESLRCFLGARGAFQPTEGPGHARELALKAARSGFAVVGAAGGDGTVHEVANGILRAARPDVCLAVYPVGSANDYAHSLRLESEWWLHANGQETTRPVDVGVVRAADGKEDYFVNGLGLGFNGLITMESQRIRKLQGVLLYGLALLRVLCFRFKTPLMTIDLDGDTRTQRTLALGLAIGRREGNFVVAPDAVIDDGFFEFLHAGALKRWQVLWRIPGMVTGNLARDHPLIWHGRCRRAKVRSESPLVVHLDGEMFCRPSDDVREIDVQLLPGALQVQTMREVMHA
ncbi:MAG TPA: diacylglycerol kinase family protein, partial [Gemmataceae bacterium]|nr:diacylglycerol kinase family protein [Gemmataceae bacterium]